MHSSSSEQIQSHYITLTICLLIFGFLSGILYPASMGIRGGILGLSLCLGVLIINTAEHKRLVTGHTPRLFIVLAASVLAGAIGGFFIDLYGTGPASLETDFPPIPVRSGISTILASISYNILFHAAYHLRWKMQKPKDKILAILFAVCCAGFAATLSKSLFDP